MSLAKEALKALLLGFERGVDDYITVQKITIKALSEEQEIRKDLQEIVDDKTVPLDELVKVWIDGSRAYSKPIGGKLAVVAHNYIPDDMPPTRNPLNPREIFTSKSKLRARYKEAGVEEVGTAYDNGYDPSHVLKEREERTNRNIHETFKRHLNRG